MLFKKIAIAVIFILALMWIVGSSLLYIDSTKELSVHASSSSSTSTTTATTTEEYLDSGVLQPLASSQNTDTATSSTYAPTLIALSATSSTQAVEKNIPVTLVVDGARFTHQLTLGASVATLLDVAQEAGELSYDGKNYRGLGMLVTAINGKQNNADKNDMYWIYSVNGKKATVGVSQYILSPNDSISWNYEPNSY